MRLRDAHVKGPKLDGMFLTSTHGGLIVLESSPTEGLVKIAVRTLGYKVPATCLYLKKEASDVELSVTVRKRECGGHYDIYRRNSEATLPSSCIESSEHVIKTTTLGRSSSGLTGNSYPIRVFMGIPGDATTNKDINRKSMNRLTEETFGKGAKRTRADATRSSFEPGEGMALVFRLGEKERGDKYWTVHAVAVLLASSGKADKFLVVSEAFAPVPPPDQKEPPLEMVKTWKVACYADAADFKFFYKSQMPDQKYALWKLRGVESDPPARVPAKKRGPSPFDAEDEPVAKKYFRR